MDALELADKWGHHGAMQTKNFDIACQHCMDKKGFGDRNHENYDDQENMLSPF